MQAGITQVFGSCQSALQLSQIWFAFQRRKIQRKGSEGHLQRSKSDVAKRCGCQAASLCQKGGRSSAGLSGQGGNEAWQLITINRRCSYIFTQNHTSVASLIGCYFARVLQDLVGSYFWSSCPLAPLRKVDVQLLDSLGTGSVQCRMPKEFLQTLDKTSHELRKTLTVKNKGPSKKNKRAKALC